MRLALAAPGLWVAGLLVSTAADAAEESEVLDAVRARLDEVGSQQLVVCAAGEDTEKAAQQLIDTLDNTIRVSRIPILGDIESETERVRVQQDVTCAIWLRGNGDTWEIGTVGPCTPPATTNAIGPVVASLPVDPTDGDPIESNAPPASGAADAPTPAGPVNTPAPAAVVLPPKLTVTDLARNSEEHHAVRWHVVDARGVAWSAPRFAETMGDTETLERLDRDLQSARVERKVLFWAGIAGLALSPVPLAFTESGAYGRNADLAWTSLFLASTGGFTLALHKVGERSEKTRQLRPALYYSRADSDALVAAYNAKVDARQAELDAAPAPTTTSSNLAIPLDAQQAAPATAAQAATEADSSNASAAPPPAELTPAASAPAESAPAKSAPAESAAPPEAADEPTDASPAPSDSSVPAEAPSGAPASAEAAAPLPAGPAPTETDQANENSAPSPDADTPEAETPEAETPDAETPDAETPDAEAPNAETGEAAVPVESPPEAPAPLPAPAAEPPSDTPDSAPEAEGTEPAGGAE